MKSHGCFALLLLALFGNAGVEAAYTVEWTHPVEHGAGAPTLFPDSDRPTGVIVSEPYQVLRLSGSGKFIWKYPTEHFISTPPTVADLNRDG
ncbi:MAG TPA: hypothetical protein PLG59_06860, partial [bacterium]|nr:hypothetical protein [bacterium]